MSHAGVADPVLQHLKEQLRKLYGARLKRVLLYGSRARGDFRADSDYDILVVLDGPIDVRAEQKKLCDLSSAILWKSIAEGQAVDVSLKPLTEEQVGQRTGFMHNVRREGVEL